MKQPRSSEWPDPARISLRGLYVISLMAMGIGIAVVFVLNFATPTDFVLNQFADLAKKTGFDYWLEVAKRLFGLFMIIAAIGSPTLLMMRQLLRPISRCLSSVRAGHPPPPDVADEARRRLINLPFMFIGINVGTWILAPALIFFSAYFADFMNLRTAVVFAVRASMVGFIASSIAFPRQKGGKHRTNTE